MEYTINTFDWEFYINEYKDLRDAGILTKEKAWWHWCTYGCKENRLNRKISENTDIKVNNKISNNHKNISKLFNIYEITEKKILINSHSNLNITSGDTIMLSNTINHLMSNQNLVTLLTTTELKDNIFERNLDKKLYTIVVKKNNDEIISTIDDLSKNNDHILLRNTQLLNQIKNKTWLTKTTLYCIGNDLEDVKNLNSQYNSIITQSEILKLKYIDEGVNKDKIQIKEPIVLKYDFDLPKRNDNEIRLIYCGTLRDEENILEIIEEFQKIHKERPEVLLKIVYGKIHGDKDFKDKVNAYIKNGVNGITFKHNLSHKDTCYEIATSDNGICWRKNGWGDNGEVSTKVKEYELYNLQIIDDVKYLIDFNLLRNIYNFKYSKKEDIILLNEYYNKKNLKKLNNYEVTFRKDIKINFIIMNLSFISKKNGYVDNELRVMCGLTKGFEVYYNDNLINDCIIENEIDIDKLNDKIIKRINSSNKSNFYDKYYGIFKNTIDYNITFFRCDNTDYIKNLFYKIKGFKVFSHSYDFKMWENEIIGFQTFVSEFMANKNILKNFKDDGTLNYNKIDTIPQKTVVRPAFIYETEIKNKNKNDNFNICIIGNINNSNNILKYLATVIKNIMTKEKKEIILYVLSKDEIDVYESFIKQKYFDKKIDYFNFLSTCDLAINTWISDVSLYSNSNKVLDCISANLPIIAPHSFHLYDILGINYPLFYRGYNYKYDIKKCILYSMNNNIKYNFNITNYNNQILSHYKQIISNLQTKILLLGVSSGKRYYGGISTNIDNYLSLFKENNFNVSGIMYDHYISSDTEYENGLKHIKQVNIYNSLMKELNYTSSKKIVIILFSWIHIDVFNFLRKKYKNIQIFLCNPGLFVDKIQNFYLNSPENCIKSDIQFEIIKQSDFVYFNSQLSWEICKKESKGKILYYNTPNYYKHVRWNNKEYDIGFIVSNTKRNIKNFTLFTNILDNLKLYKLNIIIVGLDPNEINEFQKQYPKFNITFDFNIQNKKAIDYISKTKVVINTSFFDCGPTTLFESILCNCRYVTSKNVGGNELLYKDEIVENYNSVDEWCKVIILNLINEPNRPKEILDKLSPKIFINEILEIINK